MNQQPNQPRPSIGKSLVTASYFILAGGTAGVVITVIGRAWQEIQQQLGSGAAPGVLALVVKLIYTSLSLLASTADALRDGALLGVGGGLALALAYFAFRWWRGHKSATPLAAL